MNSMAAQSYFGGIRLGKPLEPERRKEKGGRSQASLTPDETEGIGKWLIRGQQEAISASVRSLINSGIF
jgi:hypothetical protein